MFFKRTPQRYGLTPPPETPYQAAGQLWDERIGSARVQAYNWRRAFFGLFALTCGLATGNVLQGLQSKITPYVVEVDRLGEVRAVGPAEQNYQPADAQIGHDLKEFITNVRSLSSDGVVVRQRWDAAYDHLTKKERDFFDNYGRVHKPLEGFGEKTVMVQPISVVRASPSSFQVRWTEQTFERGVLVKTDRWTAMLTLKHIKPKTEAQLDRNPSGLYVDGVDWSQDTDSAPGAPKGEQGLASPAPLPVVPDTPAPAGLPAMPSVRSV